MQPTPDPLQTITPAQTRFWICQTEGILSTLMEAGLASTPEQRADVELCIEGVAEARRLAAANDLDGVARAMAAADLALHSAYARREWFWRVRRHAPLEFLYLVAVLVLILVASGNWRPGFLDWMPEVDPQVWGVPTAVLAWGALGAVTRSLYWLHKQVARRMYRGHFGLTHYSAPLIGAMFGALAYLMLQAGLITLGGGGGNGESSGNTVLSSAVALLFGFQWEPLLEWIGGVSLIRAPAVQERSATTEEQIAGADVAAGKQAGKKVSRKVDLPREERLGKQRRKKK